MVSAVTITPEQFKSQFVYDFPYLNQWTAGTVYSLGDRVYYVGKFYDSLANNNTSIPSDTDAWAQVEDSIENYITDNQILAAEQEALTLYNSSLFSGVSAQRLGLCYLTAHFLVIDHWNSVGGVNSTPRFPSASRRAGEVSETVAIPAIIQNNPMYWMLMQTGYGNKYLMMVLPRLIGVCGVAGGTTLP